MLVIETPTAHRTRVITRQHARSVRALRDAGRQRHRGGAWTRRRSRTCSSPSSRPRRRERQGLGLATVFGIVKQKCGPTGGRRFGGGLGAGRGSTFRRLLPRTDDTRRGADGEPSRHLAGHETILVVEDAPGLRAMIREISQGAGYSVVSTRPPAPADVIGTLGGVDMLLTRLVMPLDERTRAGAPSAGHPPHLKVLSCRVTRTSR